MAAKLQFFSIILMPYQIFSISLQTVNPNRMKSSFSESAPLCRLVISLMAGIVIVEYVHLPFSLFPVFIVAVVLTVLLTKWPYSQSVAIAFCFLLLGGLVMDWQKKTSQIVWPSGEVVYEAVVLSAPIEKPKTIAVDILLTGNGQKLKCYIYKDEYSRSLRIGDGLRIRSVIRQNSEWHIGHFDYRRYLESHGFAGQTIVSSRKWQRAEVSLKDVSKLQRTRLFFLRLRSRLLIRMKGDYPENDAYAVVAAMVLGDKSVLSKELKDIYSVTGAAHVLALSGLHLGVIYMLLSSLISRRRFRDFSQLVLVLSIWAFVFLVGLPISVVRSAVMLTVYALLSLGNREKMSLNVLSFTAIVMLVVNPMILFDVGFQLSFMAVGAILLFLPLFEKIVSHQYLMSHRVLRWVWELVAVSCAAQIGTAPLVAYYFGRFSTCFLLTNLIVVPAVMLILYLSVVVLIIPNLSHLLLYIVSWLNTILTSMASVPGVSIEGLHPTVLQVVMIYVVIGATCLLIPRLFRIGT